MSKLKMLIYLSAVLMLLLSTALFAVDNSKVPTQDEIVGWLDEFCRFDNRRPGEPGGHAGEDFVYRKFQEFGLENVSKEPVKITVWRAKDWSLKVQTEGGEEEIPTFYTLNTGFTPKKGLSAELVYVNSGSEEDFNTIDVAGKIAVIDMEFATLPLLPLMLLKGYYLYDPEDTYKWWAAQPACWVRKNWNVDKDTSKSAYELAKKSGALAVVWILKDQPANVVTHYGPYDGVMKDLPALYVGRDDGARLKGMLAAGSLNGTLIQTGTRAPGVMHNVHGILPGKSDEIVLITSHHDSPFKGYIEDGTGISMVLALAKYFSQVPVEEREKTMVFLASAGHFYGSEGIETWLENHREDIADRTVMNLNIEHVAAKEFVEDKNGDYNYTGKPQLRGIFIDNNDHMKDAIGEALRDNNLTRSAVIAIDALGEDPPGEGRFPHRLGIPVIHYISGPSYLLVDADNKDKVLFDELVPAAKTFIEIIEKLSHFSGDELKPKVEE